MVEMFVILVIEQRQLVFALALNEVERIITPCIPWILGNRGNPKSVNSEFIEESCLNLLSYTSQVATLVVNNVEYVFLIDFPIIEFVTIAEQADKSGAVLQYRIAC